MKIMIVTDNEYIYLEFKKIIQDKKNDEFNFDFFFSESNKDFKRRYKGSVFKPINIKDECDKIIDKYSLVISLHCKQIFPSKLVNNVRCINVHPGFNPYDRGWFPQVFGIINKHPIGVTIHEMDEFLDHGPIIVQQELKTHGWETSYDLYNRILSLEIKLLRENLTSLISSDYKVSSPSSEGNINLKKGFMELCKIDLDKKVTFMEAIDYLRAMSFKGYKNAYFYDENDNKIYVEIHLEKECLKDEQ